MTNRPNICITVALQLRSISLNRKTEEIAEIRFRNSLSRRQKTFLRRGIARRATARRENRETILVEIGHTRNDEEKANDNHRTDPRDRPATPPSRQGGVEGGKDEKRASPSKRQCTKRLEIQYFASGIRTDAVPCRRVDGNGPNSLLSNEGKIEAKLL